MFEKVELKEKIQAVDQNVRELWDAMDEVNQKLLKSEFFILNRYISNVKGQSREVQEHFVITVNEYFNKNWNDIQKHPKLLWLLLCMCSYNGEKTFFHEWIGKKKGAVDKKEKFLQEIYPLRKLDEIKLLSAITTDSEIKELARQYGMEDSEIKKRFGK